MRKRRELTDEEKKYIIDNAPNKSATQIGKELGRNQSTIRNYCITNGIKIFKKIKVVYLTEEEIKYIKDNAPKKSITQISKELKRAYTTIKEYCKANGIKPKKERVLLTDSEKNYIKDNILNKSVYQIAKDLERPYMTVKNHCIANNLEIKSNKPN